MLHVAIFLATCNATFVALQVARKNSRVTPHFATAIVAMRVARKVERSSTFRNIARQVACVWHPLRNLQAILSEWANQSSSFARLASLEHWVRHVCLRIVSLLFDFVTRNLRLATNFYHLVAKWRLTDFVNFEPCATWKVFYSSSLLCKLQEKLLRVTWPWQQISIAYS